MGKMGKVFRILGGILLLLGTFVFAWQYVGVNTVSGYGIVNIQNFLDAAELAAEDAWKVWLVLVLFVGTVISGLMLLIGVKVRAFAIIFGLIAFATGLLMVLAYLTDVTEIDQLNLYMALLSLDEPIVEGILPYILDIYNGITVGQVLVLVGGFFGFIGGCIKIED